MNSEIKETYLKYKAATTMTRNNYNNIWKRDPTRKNYPAIDKALEALHTAEYNEQEFMSLYPHINFGE